MAHAHDKEKENVSTSFKGRPGSASASTSTSAATAAASTTSVLRHPTPSSSPFYLSSSIHNTVFLNLGENIVQKDRRGAGWTLLATRSSESTKKLQREITDREELDEASATSSRQTQTPHIKISVEKVKGVKTSFHVKVKQLSQRTAFKIHKPATPASSNITSFFKSKTKYPLLVPFKASAFVVKNDTLIICEGATIVMDAKVKMSTKQKKKRRGSGKKRALKTKKSDSDGRKHKQTRLSFSPSPYKRTSHQTSNVKGNSATTVSMRADLLSFKDVVEIDSDSGDTQQQCTSTPVQRNANMDAADNNSAAAAAATVTKESAHYERLFKNAPICLTDAKARRIFLREPKLVPHQLRFSFAEQLLTVDLTSREAEEESLSSLVVERGLVRIWQPEKPIPSAIAKAYERNIQSSSNKFYGAEDSDDEDMSQEFSQELQWHATSTGGKARKLPLKPLPLSLDTTLTSLRQCIQSSRLLPQASLCDYLFFALCGHDTDGVLCRHDWWEWGVPSLETALAIQNTLRVAAFEFPSWFVPNTWRPKRWSMLSRLVTLVVDLGAGRILRYDGKEASKTPVGMISANVLWSSADMDPAIKLRNAVFGLELLLDVFNSDVYARGTCLGKEGRKQSRKQRCEQWAGDTILWYALHNSATGIGNDQISKAEEQKENFRNRRKFVINSTFSFWESQGPAIIGAVQPVSAQANYLTREKSIQCAKLLCHLLQLVYEVSAPPDRRDILEHVHSLFKSMCPNESSGFGEGLTTLQKIFLSLLPSPAVSNGTPEKAQQKSTKSVLNMKMTRSQQSSGIISNSTLGKIAEMSSNSLLSQMLVRCEHDCIKVTHLADEVSPFEVGVWLPRTNGDDTESDAIHRLSSLESLPPNKTAEFYFMLLRTLPGGPKKRLSCPSKEREALPGPIKDFNFLSMQGMRLFS